MRTKLSDTNDDGIIDFNETCDNCGNVLDDYYRYNYRSELTR